MLPRLTRLGWAAPALSRALHSGTRTASSVASRAKRVERQLTSEEVYAREERYGAHNYHPLPVALERGEGQYASTLQPHTHTLDTVDLRQNEWIIHRH